MAFSVDFSIPGKYFLKETESGAESSRTCVFWRQNGEELFFRFECKEEFFYPKHYGYNEPLYEGDIVELMITLGSKNRYLETETNFNGADYCVIIENKDGEGDIEIFPLEKNLVKSKVETLVDGWACDIILDIKELKKIGLGKDVFFNAHRQDFDENGILRLYSLNPTLCRTFHRISAFLRAEIKEV